MPTEAETAAALEVKLRRAMVFARLPETTDTVHDYPVLWRYAPKWWEFKKSRFERRLADGFKMFGLPPITQEMRDMYWREVRKGQSVYEDAGGYMLRCWLVALGADCEEPYTYSEAISDLFEDAGWLLDGKEHSEMPGGGK